MNIGGISAAGYGITSLVNNGAATVQGQAAITMLEEGVTMAETAMSKLFVGMEEILENLGLQGNEGTGLGQYVDITI